MRTDHSLSNQAAESPTAVLVIDMVSTWKFPDAERLLPFAVSIAPRIAALLKRCRQRGVAVIYANDHHGRWRSNFEDCVDASLDAGGEGAEITRQLHPQESDYFVLKPRHSAFFATPLELLLKDLKTDELLITGVASDQCVLATVAEARMRGFQVRVPADCVATQGTARNARALRHLEEVLSINIASSSRWRPRR